MITLAFFQVEPPNFRVKTLEEQTTDVHWNMYSMGTEPFLRVIIRKVFNLKMLFENNIFFFV